jgi:hypothetical protein
VRSSVPSLSAPIFLQKESNGNRALVEFRFLALGAMARSTSRDLRKQGPKKTRI